MTQNADNGRRPVGILLGAVAGLAAFATSAEVTHRFLGSEPALRHVGVLLSVTALFVIAIVLSWKFPSAALGAGVTLTAAIVIGQIVWGPQYIDVDPMNFDLLPTLAFGSQQLTSAALVPAVLLPALFGRRTFRSSVGASSADASRRL